MSTFVNEKQNDDGGHHTSARQAPSLVKQKEGQHHERVHSSQSFETWRRTMQNIVQMRNEDTDLSNEMRKVCARTA